MKVIQQNADNKRRNWLLAGLGVAAAFGLYSFSSSDSATPAPSAATAAAPAALPADAGLATATQHRGSMARRTSSEWRPKLRGRAEDRPDPAKIDPTLRLDLLAKVQSVALEGGSRNLFQFGVAPPPPVALTPIKNPGKIAVNNPPPAMTVPIPTTPPPAPPPPPIPLKYYGFSNARGESRKKAFFLDGDDIIVAWEGDTIKNHYKVIHVGVNSVDMEDTQNKNRQTLPLAEEAQG